MRLSHSWQQILHTHANRIGSVGYFITILGVMANGWQTHNDVELGAGAGYLICQAINIVGGKNSKTIVSASVIGLGAACTFGAAAIGKDHGELQMISALTSGLAHVFRIAGDSTPHSNNSDPAPLLILSEPLLIREARIEKMAFGYSWLKPFARFVDYGLSHPMRAGAQSQEFTRPLTVITGILNHQPILAGAWSLAWVSDRILYLGRKER